MADSDRRDPINDPTWETIRDEIVESVLIIQEEVQGLTLVDPENPADFSKFAKTLIGTLIAVITVGVGAIQNAFFEGLAGYPNAIASFTEDVVLAVLTIPGDLLATAAEASATGASEWGMLSFVAGVAVVLISLYIAAKGLEVVR